MGKSRLFEHKKLVSWLVEYVAKNGISVVLLAGDVFDTSTPPSYARELYHELALRLAKIRCGLIVIAGNHDSVSVLNESKGLLAHIDVHVITQPSWVSSDDALIYLKDDNGKTCATVCAIPFLRAQDMVAREAGQTDRQKKEQLESSIQDYYQRLYDMAKQEAPDLPIIGTGHLTMIGGEKTDAMRDIYVGTLDALSPSVLPPFDYLALGHIHKPIRVGRNDHWRYSGSPFPMSFDELASQKSVSIYDTELNSVELETIPVFRVLKRLQGSRDSLLQQIDELDHTQEATAWLELTIEEDINLGMFQEQIAERLVNRPFEVLKIQRLKTVVQYRRTDGETATLDDLAPTDVFSQLLAEKDIEPSHAAALSALFDTYAVEQDEDSV